MKLLYDGQGIYGIGGVLGVIKLRWEGMGKGVLAEAVRRRGGYAYIALWGHRFEGSQLTVHKQDFAEDNGLPRALCAVQTEGECRGCGATVDGA
jgi:hypothetical protein